MERATLAGITGIGELKVVRAAEGDATEVMGIWRLEDGASQDLAPLHDLQRSGERTLYRGLITDPNYPDVAEVELEVVISGIEAYTYDHGDGETRDLVKITGVGPLSYEGELPAKKEIEKPVISPDE